MITWHYECNNCAECMCTCVYTFSCVVILSCLQPNCDINAKDDSGLTALHIAVHEGHTKMVERLVGYGADLNCTTEEGNTPLHLTLGRNTMLPPSHLTPEIMQVRSYFLLHGNFEFEEHDFTACLTCLGFRDTCMYIPIFALPCVWLSLHAYVL